MVAHDLRELRRVVNHNLILLQMVSYLLAVNRNEAEVEGAEVVVVALVEKTTVKVKYHNL